jgi:hypothetical protein
MDINNLTDKYDFKKIKNGYTYNGAKLRITEIRRKDGEHMTRKAMIKLCDGFLQELRQTYPDAEGLVSVSIKFTQRWYSGDVSSFNNSINYFTPSDSALDFEDPEDYEAIRFQFIPFRRIAEGGKDPNNDCLITCLRKFFKANDKFIDAADLKTHLDLKRGDPIPLTCMKKVESYINDGERNKYAIFVSGDAEYTSVIDSTRQIHLILSNGHFSVNTTKINKTSRLSFDEKAIMIINPVDRNYETFDGETVSMMTRQEYEAKRDEYTHLMVWKDFTPQSNKMEISDAYHYYLEMADELKEASNGKFNMYRCPTLKNIALNYFYDLTKSVQPEDISNNEAKWINASSSHAMTYWKPYKGYIHAFDVNSRYPHIMQKTTNMFPIKAGKWRTINKIAEKPEFGIYRCVITKKDNKPYKFFVFNDENHYTHLDISVALSYSLHVELIEDGQPNFLHYPKDCLISGSYLFGRYVETLYELKLKGVKAAKPLLSMLWGSLGERKIFKQTTDMNEVVDLSERNITRLQTDTFIRTHYTKHDDSQFRTNYGRIKPYVLAYARSQNYFSFRKWEHLIMRAHTDSLYLTEIPGDMLPPSKKLGMLKLEYEGYIEISGLNKVVKELKKMA